jgi:ABC-type nickel/cobalt efflux system permease component RcnA
VHVHSHDGAHGHSHLPPGAGGEPVTWRGLLALGVSGGLLPCPSALVLMLGAISLNRIGFGLLLIIAFSLGLAGVLTLFGIALVHAGKLFERIPEGGRLLRLASAASALFITAAGLLITAQALGQTGLFSRGGPIG